jgi:ligand-binding sensor domain-containing protein
MKIKIFLGFLLLFINIRFVYSVEQNNTPWINFTDMKNVIAISVDNINSKAYCGTSGGLYIVDLNNGNIIRKYTNIDGLITTNITAMILDNYGRLWIGGSDGSISILNYSSSTWNYIYDIKNSSESNKIINSFALYNGYIFVATGFGIEKISTATLNFVDAPYYQLGSFTTKSKVYTLTIENNMLFAGTPYGIAYANLNSNLNLPSTWTNYSSYPMNSNINIVQTFDNKVFAGSDSGFVYFDNQNWIIYPNSSVSNKRTTSIAPIGDNLYFISGGNIFYANKNNLQNLNQYIINGNYSYNILANGINNPIVGMYENGIYLNVNNYFSVIFPNCPYRNSFNYLSFDNNNGALICTGGLGDAGFYVYDGTAWNNYNYNTYPALTQGNDFRRIVNNNGTIWATNYGNGVFEIAPDTIINFNTTNSTLPNSNDPSHPLYCVPFGIALDNNGLVWCTFFASNTSKSLYVHINDTLWFGYLNISSPPSYEALAIDNYNTKWMAARNSQGLYFFNENNTLTYTPDDIYGFYSSSGAFGGNDIVDVTVDKNNTIWIATSNGVYIIDNPLGAIQNPINPPIPQKLGIISGNLKVPFTENCKCITSDVLNQKWIGTQNSGVFHLSDDGSTLIEQFNTTNSPLLTNEVKSIAVDPKSGRAYFATINGLSSIQTDALQPVADFDKIICSPNPYLVPPKVNMKIDGLIENSSLKIITLTGDIVAEFDSPGGRIATWNGQDKKGNYVSSGIYIIIAFNKDGSKVGKGKVAVVRR